MAGLSTVNGVGDSAKLDGPDFSLPLPERMRDSVGPISGRKLVAELWLYPDNSMILELSTKCAPSEAFQVAAETRAFLAQHGVDLSGAVGDVGVLHDVGEIPASGDLAHDVTDKRILDSHGEERTGSI